MNGTKSPRVQRALQRFDRLISEMDQALQQSAWLVGDDLTLADIGYAPYATRLEHLSLTMLWDRRPHFAAWYEKLRATRGYREGVARWINADYITVMGDAGKHSLPHVSELLAA